MARRRRVPVWGPDMADKHEVSLKIQVTLPIGATIWVVGYENYLYVLDSNISSLCEIIGDRVPFNISLAGSAIELRAERVTKNIGAITAALIEKYRGRYPDIIGNSLFNSDVTKNIRVSQLERTST